MAFGGETRRVVLEFVGDATSLQGASKKASGALDGVSGAGKKTSGALAALKPAAMAAGAAAAAMAAQWAIAGIGMAEAAEQAAVSFDKTFGEAGADLLAQNEELRTSLGLTEGEFMKLATSVGAANVNMGASSEEAAAFTSSIITVAGDVAAFNGELGTSEQVIEAVGAAMRGEFDPLEKYGVALKAADVEARALNDTGKESADQLTDLEKRTATLALVQEQAALQQGALADAVESGATTQNEATATMKEAQTAVGDALLPVKKLAAEGFLVLAEILVALTPVFETLGEVIATVTKILSPLIQALGWVIEKLAQVISWTHKLFSPISHAIYLFEKLSSKIRSAFSWTPPSWMQSMGIRGFHSGGTVPGTPGTLTPIMAQAGETVGTQAQASAGGHGGGTVINITVNTGVGDPMAIGQEISEILGEYSRQVGGIALDVADGGG